MIDPRLQAIIDQLDTMIIILQRPVVQRQLVAFVVIFLLSWLLPAPLGVLLKRLVAQQTVISKRRKEMGLPPREWRTRLLRWARGLQMLLFPVVGLVFSQLTLSYFVSQGWPGGLLGGLAAIFWLVLIYRAVSTVVFASLDPDAAKTYHRRFVTPVFVILVIVIVTNRLLGTFPIFDLELFAVLGTPITLNTVGMSLVVFYIFLAASWVVQDVLGKVVLPRVNADAGVTNTVLVTSRYALIAIGAMAALSTIGFDLSALTIIFGGLSVGIGFGLQELVANFISGILLLFEQSLRPGDIIEVSGQRGIVSQLQMRATVLRTYDNIEVIVPNKTLLTSTVSTYTMSDRNIRRLVPVGVSYDSNATEVRDILMRVMENHGLILDDPAPTVFFTGFGDSSLDFQCAYWIGDPARGLQVDSDIHFMIFREFEKNGIEIPFPQRDLHLRSASALSPEQLQRINGESGTQVPSQEESVDQNRGSRDGEDRRAETPVQTPVAAAKLSPDRVKAPAEKPNLPG